MHSHIEAVFDDAENRHLKPEELNALNQYVESLPNRLEIYRQLRDQEMSIMQPIANQLESQFQNEQVELLERCLKNALLVMRYCAMAMLLNDEAFVQNRLAGWLEQITKAYNTKPVDEVLYRLLDRRLREVFSPTQLGLLTPHLTLAQDMLLR
jgi:hypothetical protein